MASLTEAQDAHVRSVFSRTPLMVHMAVDIRSIDVGHIVTAMPIRPEFRQQHGLAHAGIMATLADHTAGACACTHGDRLDVLSIEFKINMLAPAAGHWLFCRADTLRPGKRITVVEAMVFVADGDRVGEQITNATLCAKATVTLSVRAA
jgi:uncharacterized protein (TIGR00369 family)